MIHRHLSNKTIFEESERSGTMTEQTPIRDLDASKSPYDFRAISKKTSKLED